MSVSYWQDTVGLATSPEVDVTIIGGGLSGLSTAYWLSKKDPALKIIVLEKGLVGNGASGRNAGFITCGSTDHFSNMTSSYGKDKAEEIWKFTEYNHNLMVEEFGLEKLNEKCEYRRLGSWTLASSKHEAKVIKKSIAPLKKQGVDVEWKDTIFKGSEGFYGGAHYKDDGEIHPVKYLWHLAISTGRNVQIMENSEVFGIDDVDGSLVVRTAKKRVFTEAVILCTNAWSSQLFPWCTPRQSPPPKPDDEASPCERLNQSNRINSN